MFIWNDGWVDICIREWIGMCVLVDGLMWIDGYGCIWMDRCMYG